MWTNGQELIVARTFDQLAEGRDVLLTVNRGLEPIDVEFQLDRSNGVARVLSEDRQVKLESSNLRDHFEPLATHIFELPAK